MFPQYHEVREAFVRDVGPALDPRDTRTVIQTWRGFIALLREDRKITRHQHQAWRTRCPIIR